LIAAEVQNYDEQQGAVRWFRFASNPDPLIVPLADEFNRGVSSLLKLRHSVGEDEFDGVKLHWIEPVETTEARGIWVDCPEPETQPDWTDQISVRCSCFSLKCRDEEFIEGCTPIYSKGHVLIQSGLSYARTLRVIADECYHVFQDLSRGGDWRNESDDHLVESEAAEFADSLAILIRRFLEERGVLQK
jgi:hypothetical protein